MAWILLETVAMARPLATKAAFAFGLLLAIGILSPSLAQRMQALVIDQGHLSAIQVQRRAEEEPAGVVRSAETRVGGARVALVIGNGTFANWNTLLNPPHDARLVAKVLRLLDFDVMEGIDLDRTTMESQIGDFVSKANSASIALFYYSGHAMQIEGKNYLWPIDVKLAHLQDVPFETIDLDEVLARLDNSSRPTIVLL